MFEELRFKTFIITFIYSWYNISSICSAPTEGKEYGNELSYFLPLPKTKYKYNNTISDYIRHVLCLIV